MSEQVEEAVIITERVTVEDGGTHSISGGTFYQCENSGSSWPAYGGAIGAYKGELTVSNVTFHDNFAPRGGAITVGNENPSDVSVINIENCKFLGNRASDASLGTELFVNGDGVANVKDTQFLSGSILVQGKLNIFGNVVINGTVYNSGNNNTITVKSGATLSLGTISFKSTNTGVLTIEDGGIIEFNGKVTFGGHNSSTSIKDLSNAALKVGSGLLNSASSDLAAGDFTVGENVSTIIGGNTVKIGSLGAASADRIGIVKYDGSKLSYASAGALTLASAAAGDFTVSDFAAVKDGLTGYTGLINVTGGDHTVADWTFSDNTSRAMTVSSGEILLEKVTFANNSSSADGGALYVSGSSVTVKFGTFSNNTAGGAGGAMFVSGGSVTVENSTFSGNKGNNAYGGNAIRINKGGSVTLKDSVVNDSICPNGELYIDGVVELKSIIANYGGSVTVKSGATLSVGSGFVSYQHKGIVFESGSILECNTTAGFRDTGGGLSVVQDISNVTVKVGSAIINNSSARLADNVSVGEAQKIMIGDKTAGLDDVVMLDAHKLASAKFLNNNLNYYTSNALTLSASAVDGVSAADWDDVSADLVGYEGRVIVADGVHNISDWTFSGNTTSGDANWGGAIAVHGGTVTIDNVAFTNNKADRGGAVYVKTGAVAHIINSEFSQNSSSLGADLFVQSDAVATVTDSTLGGSICVQGALTFLGEVALGGSVYHYNGSINVGKNATLNLIDNITINTSVGINFAENSTLKFSKDLLVRDSGGNYGAFTQDLSGANVEVAESMLATGYSVEIARGVSFGENQTVTVAGNSYDFGEEFEYNGRKYAFNYANNVFSAKRLFDTVYAAYNGVTEVVIGGETVALNGANVFADAATAEANMASGGKLIIAAKDFANPETLNYTAAELVLTGTCTGEATVEGGTAHIRGNVSDRVNVTYDNFTYDGDCLFLQNSQSITGNWDVTFNAAAATKVVHYKRGYFYTVDNASVGGDVNIVLNDSSVGRIYALSGTTSVVGDVNVMLDNSTLNDGHLTLSSASGSIGGDINIVLQNNSLIAEQLRGTGSNEDSAVAGNVNITIDESCVIGNIYGGYGNTVNGSVNIVLSGATVNGSIHKAKTGSVKGGMNISVSGVDNTVNSLVGADTLTFVAGAKLAFATATDLSGVMITVDGSAYENSAVTVATGVTAIDKYTIANNSNPYLTLAVVGNDLVLKEIDAQITEGSDLASYTGSGVTIMDGGKVSGAFIAQKTSSATTIATTITGGSLETNTIAGAFAKAEEGNVSVKNTELNIGGEADVNGQVYAGGYFYGIKDAERATEAQMTVDSVNIALDGGKVNGNLYAGIHARQNANVKVGEVNISINGGEHDRVYAGGWAEGNAQSTVDKSTITFDGGKVNFIYGGGANGQGVTYVGVTTITVGANAEIGTIFMSGRYGYSEVGTVELNWYGQNDMKRLSGVSSAGIDNADSTTVKLFSSLTADGIDYVDKFVLDEGVKLNCTGEFLLGNRNDDGTASDATIFDFTTDGLTEAWDAIAGISDFEHAKFSINGGEAVAWGEGNTLALGSYTLTRTEESKDKYSISIA